MSFDKSSDRAKIDENLNQENNEATKIVNREERHVEANSREAKSLLAWLIAFPLASFRLPPPSFARRTTTASLHTSQSTTQHMFCHYLTTPTMYNIPTLSQETSLQLCDEILC